MEIAELTTPLALVQIEEKQVCLGHKNFIQEYKNRNKAKEDGFSWEIDAKNNPLFKAVSFTVERLGHKQHRLYHLFEHIDDVNECNHNQAKVFRNVCRLRAEEFTQLIPILEE